MEPTIQKLKQYIAEIVDIASSAGLLSWDQQVNMPPGGAEDRGDQLATLAGIAHTRVVSDELGRMLDEVQPYVATLDPESDDACFVQLVREQYERETRVSSEWVAEFARVTTLGQSAWEKAREENDFAHFQPYLEQIVELRRQYASFFAPFDHVYDPLLHEFERGMKTSEVRAIFDVLRPRQVELIRAIGARPQVDDSFLHQDFDVEHQWDFGVDVITHFGYDWQRGRQDRSAHPFTINFGQGDVRITTRVMADHMTSAMFSTFHECGHALYEQGIDRALRRSPLSTGASMAVHESQSRLWENLVGRSRAFWTFFYPKLQAHFPAQLGNVSMESFYRAINKVEPSLIRTESDEATYNLHIMLRLEIEIALMEGSLRVADLPQVWTERMQEYLGVTPPNNARGVLQDIHWSGGMIGYFPTYALGNLVSVQLWECIQRDVPDLEEQIMRGKFDDLLGWLRTNIHRHGSKFTPQTLIKKVTGEGINPQPYLRYLQTKFGDIYGL